MDKVLINDLVARGIIGVNDWEREHPQEIVINIVLFTDLRPAGASDDLVDCVNYQTVADKVVAHAETAQRFTVEALAADIAAIAFQEPAVRKVRVRVEKPGAVPSTRSVGVEIKRERGTGRTGELRPAIAERRPMIDDPRDHSACLGLGSNSGPEAHLPLALTAVGRTSGVEVVAVSSAWESPAVGTRGPDYLNAALIVRTGLSMEALKAELRRIEADLGRVRSREPCPLVTIDIDLLTFDAKVIEPDLWNLAYRALPVSELLPDLISPSTGEALADAAIRLAGTTRIAARPEVLPTSAHEVAPS